MTANMPLTPQPPKEYQDDLLRHKPDPNSIPPQALKAMQTLPPEKAYKNAANNFYAIAGFSFLNSLIWLFGLKLVFVIGLGITQLVDGIAYVFKQNAGEAGFIFTAGYWRFTTDRAAEKPLLFYNLPELEPCEGLS